MKLIVGLGNPGKVYAQSRHNIGFIIIDKLLSELNLEVKVDQNLNAAYVKTSIEGQPIILAKPLTYMNLSGDALSKLMNYYKIDISDILIISDDVSLPLAKIRLRESGSHGGQNGLRNIIERLGSSNFKRMRIGIGKDDRMPMTDYVLGKFSKAELAYLMPAFDQSVSAILEWIKTNNFNNTMSKYNTPQTA